VPDSVVTSGPQIPFLLTLSCTLFVAILVPIYWWYYGPSNFLWFSDLALFITTAALWLESPLLASTQVLSVGFLEMIWLADFLIQLVSRRKVIGLSAYMFDPKIPRTIRGLSLFHVVLPFLPIWLVWRLGYDERALLVQTLLAWAVLLSCYFLTSPKENINWVFGPGKEQQRWLRPPVYLLVLMAFFPVCIYFPSHLVLQYLFGCPVPC